MSHDKKYPASSFKVTVDHIRTYAIFTMDLQGMVTSWNEGALRIYGWKEHEIIGKNVSVLFNETDAVKGLPERMFKRQETKRRFEDEVLQRRKNGDLFTAAITTSPFIGGDANKSIGYLQIAKDVTDRNKREEDQLSANDLLRSEIERRKLVEEQLNLSNQELDAFASAASHDLQEPLRMVISYLQLIERRYRPLFDQDGQEFLNFAVDGAERMKTLISDLVEYSRIDKLGKKFEKTDADVVLKRVLNNMEVIIEESDAVITHDTLPEVWSDGIQLSQAFQNLLINAIKFKGKEKPKIHVSAEETSKEIIFSVKDNGRGIDKKDIPGIFMIFKQLGDRSERSGSGVGLALVKKIATRHRGSVWAESKVGVGSTFFLSIPKHEEN
jgi:PAS domain S-box-containing protein